MPNLSPILQSWAAGEVTPRTHLRTDLKGYKEGAKTLENFFSTSHGPIVRRGGWEYVATIPGGSSGRLFPFDIAVGSSFVIVVTNDNTLRIYNDLGQVNDAGDNLFDNPSFQAGGADWITVEAGGASVVFVEGSCELGPTGGSRAAIQQEVTSVGGGGNVHDLIVALGTSLSALTVRIGTTQGANDIAEFDILNESTFEATFTPPGDTFWTDFSAEPGADNQVITAVFAHDTTVPVTPVEFTHPWESINIATLQVDVPSGTLTMYMVSDGIPVQKLVYAPDIDLWTFDEVIFTMPPAEWTGDNHPSVIAFYQGRMWLAATDNEPETFWASRPLLFEDFTQGVNADDAFTFALSERGRIRWMKGVKNFLIGTLNGEHIITSELGLVQPGDIQAERQSSFGSKIGQSSQLGTQVLYISPDGRKIREMGYQWTEEGWVSRDLLFYSEHMTKNRERIRGTIAWAQNPGDHLWLSTVAGTLFAATYERAYDVIGWHRHPTQGHVYSITVTSLLGADTEWVLIDREIDGVEGTLFLEKMDPDQFADSHTAFTNDTPTDQVSVPWLPNTEVIILADGATHPKITLDGNGDGTLARDATNVIIGIAYTSKLVTLPIDATTQSGGTIKVAFKRWAKLFVSILGSYPPLINGVRQPTRFPESPMGEIDEPRTEYVETTQLGYDRDGAITVEEELPIALEINGIFGAVTFDDT